jgi:hypothetical protein
LRVAGLEKGEKTGSGRGTRGTARYLGAFDSQRGTRNAERIFWKESMSDFDPRIIAFCCEY